MDIRNIGVVGAGTMGKGIARAAAQAGFAVTVVKWNKDASVEEARRAFEASLAKEVERGLPPEKAADVSGRIAWAERCSALADCDLVIESVVEDLKIKLGCFSVLEETVKPGAILASNTSTLGIAELAEATRRPDRVLGLHFFNPVSVMELVEVPVPHGVAAEAREAALAFAHALGKQAFVVKDSPGFVVNRLLMSSPLEAVRMAYEEQPPVAGIETIDACVRLGLRHPMGPFQLMDHIGLDVVEAMGISLQENLRAERFSPPGLLDRMIQEGWLGKKAGLGFYDYSDRKRPRPNPGLAELASRR